MVHHFRENSSMGQEETCRSLKAFSISTVRGAYMNNSTIPTMTISPAFEAFENLSIYMRSNEPVRLASIKYMITNAIGTIEKAAATGGFRLMLEAMIEPTICVFPPTNLAAR